MAGWTTVALTSCVQFVSLFKVIRKATCEKWMLAKWPLGEAMTLRLPCENATSYC